MADAPPAKRLRQTQLFSEATTLIPVTTALEAYFDGLHQCDAERLKDCQSHQEVWHPRGRLYGLAGSDLVDCDAETFFDRVAKRPRGREELRQYDQIIRLDFASPRCCAAKVQIALPASPPVAGVTEARARGAGAEARLRWNGKLDETGAFDG
eukprot:Skav201244  [mRNA]  locus=scaffold3106:63765:65002:- [translate_table: standard]